LVVPTTVDTEQTPPEDGRTPRELEVQIARSRVSEQAERERSRIVMVDPHPYSAEGLRALLGMRTDDLEIVSIAHGADMVIEEILRHSADLLLIEPQLPGTMSTIKAVRELSGDIKIIALTTQEDSQQAIEVIKVGAHAYISKQIEPDELICVLRLVRAGRVILSAFAARALVGRPEESAGMLSTQDRKLLELIAEGLDNGEIARRLSVSESTLKRNISRLLKKLNARNKIQAAVRAASKGLLEDCDRH
jgi:DNA-binding NarL/FixJ family response regulator